MPPDSWKIAQAAINKQTNKQTNIFYEFQFTVHTRIGGTNVFISYAWLQRISSHYNPRVAILSNLAQTLLLSRTRLSLVYHAIASSHLWPFNRDHKLPGYYLKTKSLSSAPRPAGDWMEICIKFIVLILL
jgi:hypothetical protein